MLQPARHLGEPWRLADILAGAWLRSPVGAAAQEVPPASALDRALGAAALCELRPCAFRLAWTLYSSRRHLPTGADRGPGRSTSREGRAMRRDPHNERRPRGPILGLAETVVAADSHSSVSRRCAFRSGTGWPLSCPTTAEPGSPSPTWRPRCVPGGGACSAG
jgi:hypothetical protein